MTTVLDPTIFVHPHGLCESKQVGAGSRIWAFAHILPNARIGRECNICDGVFIENEVIIGDRVTVKSGVQLWDGVTLEDDVFVGPNATFTNDMYPRSKQRPPQFLRTLVKRGASIGANATILPGLIIGELAMIGAGSVVTRNVPARAIVAGNPARIVGYSNIVTQAMQSTTQAEADTSGQITSSHLKLSGCKLWRFPRFSDVRGDITVAEFDRHMPFEVRRIFFMYGVPTSDVRGEHAHRTCAQVLLPLNGVATIVVDDGAIQQEIRLSEPDIGLLIPPKIWSIQYHFSPGSVIAVFCSENYDPNEYIRDYDEFLNFVGRSRRS